MDPVEQMKLDEMRRAVEAAGRHQELRDTMEGAMRSRVPERARGGSPMPLRFYPDPALDAVASETVQLYDRGLRRLTEDMLFTMYATGGVGLAAPQVGETWRLFVADWSKSRQHPTVVVSPEVVSMSSELVIESEACLSMPGTKISIERPTSIEARWRDERGKLVETSLVGWAARIFLHELDHLDGLTMLARTRNTLERRQAIKKLGKVRRIVGPVSPRAAKATKGSRKKRRQ